MNTGQDDHVDEDEESGVVWEDDVYDDQEYIDDPDEFAFGEERETLSDAPEVELAAPRDVRPKAPRPAPKPRPKAPPKKAERPPKPRPPAPEPDWEAEDRQSIHEPSQRLASIGSTTPESAPLPAEPQPQPIAAAHADRFSRTRATMGTTPVALTVDDNEHVLQRPRGEHAQRRRHAPPGLAPMPRSGRQRASRHGRGRSRGLLVAVVLILLVGGGWFASQALGPDGLQPIIDRLAAIMPFPNSTRTAADTSFGDPGASTTVPAEQALSDLEARVREEIDAAAIELPRTEGPPIPQFKPLPGDPAPTTNTEQVAASDDSTGNEQATPPSIFEQLWRYINPG